MICFLDLGTSKVSGLLIDDLSTSTIHAFSSVETSGVKKGSIINISTTASSISKCLRNIEQQSGFKIKEVLVSVSGEEVSSTNSVGQVAISEKEVSARDIENALNNVEQFVSPISDLRGTSEYRIGVVKGAFKKLKYSLENNTKPLSIMEIV